MPDGYGRRVGETSGLLCWRGPSCSVSPTSESEEKDPCSAQQRKIGVIHLFPYAHKNQDTNSHSGLSSTNIQYEFIFYEHIHFEKDANLKSCVSHNSQDTNLKSCGSLTSLNCWFHYIYTDRRSNFYAHTIYVTKYAHLLAKAIVFQALQLVSKEIKIHEYQNKLWTLQTLNNECLSCDLPGVVGNECFDCFYSQRPSDSKRVVDCMIDKDVSPASFSQSSTEQSRHYSLEPLIDLPLFTIDRSDILLFFIHGLGGSSSSWKFQLSYFSNKGYEILALDLIGHGSSGAPDNPNVYTFHQMMRDVLTVFDCHAKSRNVVIGHSYGCAFAACLIQQRPYLIQQLVLLSGGRPKAIKPRQGLSALIPVWGLSFLKPFFSFISESRRIGHMVELARIASLPRYVLRHILAGQDWPQGGRSFYRTLATPTLLIYGLRDQFISLEDEREMEEIMPCAHLATIPGAGHSVMLDAPDVVNETIYKFLMTAEDSEGCCRI